MKEIAEIVLKLGIAILIGGLIGYEREFKNRPAGFRTHILVCIGATVISMIQVYTINSITNLILAHPGSGLQDALKADVGRMGAQVVSGIGFLGAGTILHEKGSIKGLTTAASLWVVACIGLAIGLGEYKISICSAIATYIVLVFLKKFEFNMFDKTNIYKFRIYYKDKKNVTQLIDDYFEKSGIKVSNIEFSMDADEENTLYTICIPRYMKLSSVIQKISTFDDVIKVNAE